MIRAVKEIAGLAAALALILMIGPGGLALIATLAALGVLLVGAAYLWKKFSRSLTIKHDETMAETRRRRRYEDVAGVFFMIVVPIVVGLAGRHLLETLGVL